MGKTKSEKRRNGTSRILASPTGLPSIQQLEKDMEKSLEGIDIVLEKLNSADADDKEYGCAALSNYISNPLTLRELMNRNVGRLIAPLLLDAKLSVQLAASSLLRSMSEEGGFEACEQMIRQDAFTGIGAFLRNQLASLKQSTGELRNDGHIHSFINCIYTAQNLCECSALAVRMAIEDSLPDVLIGSLEVDRFPAPVHLAAAQCLYTISEENETVGEFLKRPQSQQLLSAIITNDKVLLYTRVMLVGVQFNTYGLELLRVDCGEAAVSLLLLALDTNSYQTMTAALRSCVDAENSTKKRSNAPSNGPADDMDDGDDTHSKKTNPTENDLRKELESLDNLISAQKLSFEILTNILGGDDTEDWADMSADDSDSCGTASDTNEFMEDEEMESCTNDQTASRLADRGLIKLLGQRIQFVQPDVYDSVENSDKMHRQPLKSTIKGYDSMLTSALLCLNNAMSQCKLDKFGGAQCVRSMLKLLLSTLSLTQVSSQESLVESIAGAVRSITEQLISQSEHVTFDEAQLTTLQQLTTVSHTATAVNAVRALAAVGVLLSKKQTSDPVVKGIGTVLMQVATSSKELWLVAETLDSVMDVFAEDSNNVYLTELGVLSTLNVILPQLKAMVAKRDKTKDHFLPVLTTVRSNLPRFIKYKNKVI